jgi:hypothetical protein
MFPLAFASRADDLSSVADQLVIQLQKAHKKAIFPRIVVSSFSNSAGHVSQLTEKLSSEFSDLLSVKLVRDPS